MGFPREKPGDEAAILNGGGAPISRLSPSTVPRSSIHRLFEDAGDNNIVVQKQTRACYVIARQFPQQLSGPFQRVGLGDGEPVPRD